MELDKSLSKVALSSWCFNQRFDNEISLYLKLYISKLANFCLSDWHVPLDFHNNCLLHGQWRHQGWVGGWGKFQKNFLSCPQLLSEIKKNMGIFLYKLVKTYDFLRVLPWSLAPPPKKMWGWWRHCSTFVHKLVSNIMCQMLVIMYVTHAIDYVTIIGWRPSCK